MLGGARVGVNDAYNFQRGYLPFSRSSTGSCREVVRGEGEQLTLDQICKQRSSVMSLVRINIQCKTKTWTKLFLVRIPAHCLYILFVC
jgi:hypothetical protein